MLSMLAFFLRYTDVRAMTQVKVNFYGEALCPYCARFLADTVAPLFAEGFAPYMDFR